MKAYFYCYVYEIKGSNKFGIKFLRREVDYYYATPDKMNGKSVELLRQGEDEVTDVVLCDPNQMEFLYIGDFIYGNFMMTPVFEVGDLIRVCIDL